MTGRLSGRARTRTAIVALLWSRRHRRQLLNRRCPPNRGLALEGVDQEEPERVHPGWPRRVGWRPASRRRVRARRAKARTVTAVTVPVRAAVARRRAAAAAVAGSLTAMSGLPRAGHRLSEKHERPVRRRRDDVRTTVL